MELQVLITQVECVIGLTSEEKFFFINLLKIKEISKKDFLLKQGQVCRASAFVISGAFRGYTVQIEGAEHILNFATPNWWIADLYSLYTEQPGILNVQATENSRIIILTKTDQEKLYKRIPAFERFFRLLTEKSLVAYQRRTVENLSFSTEKRYNLFFERFPVFNQTFSRKDIASFIGVSPEFLSRLQHRILKQT
jgi:CRP-like cAMP-binding protein